MTFCYCIPLNDESLFSVRSDGRIDDEMHPRLLSPNLESPAEPHSKGKGMHSCEV
jgi:hypothetical protein